MDSRKCKNHGKPILSVDAMVTACHAATGAPSVCVCGKAMYDGGDEERNDRLSDAAPDLLEALVDLADDHEFGNTGTMRQDHLRAARAAIAKATGA